MSKKVSLCAAIIIFLAVFIFSASTSRAEINVYDNDGQYVGILVGIDHVPPPVFLNYIRVFIPSIGKFVLFYASADEYIDLEGISELFETTDCTGPSYSHVLIDRETPYPSLFQSIYKTCRGSWVTNGGLKVITPRSYMQSCECIKSSQETTSAAELVTTSAPPFTLPVKLPFRYEHSILGVEKVVIGPP